MPGLQDIIGQEQIKEHLHNAIEQQKISHAYIIQGERSSGKEFIAKAFAQTLQCEKGGTEPCGECHACKQALSANHPDIIRIMHEKPNAIGIDDIREQLTTNVQIKPYSGPYKIYIINEGEKMTPAAQNALLKTLEEPPAYAVILLLVTTIDALLPTIQSRCVTLNMRPVKDELVKKYLMSDVKLTDYKADVCVAFARGNIGRARLLATSEDFDNICHEALTLVRNIKKMSLAEMVMAVKKLHDYQMDTDDYLDVLLIWYRDVLMFKATHDVNHLIFKDEISSIRKLADKSTYEGIENIIDAIQKAKQRMLANVKFELVMELLFTTIQEN
ncbi:MAG: DNA polymerase III subunit delta' [Lachnospiraceae bacterium]|nr:DNA polymerase III subunit delta' [Lachnospiraceae bacterium]